MLDAAVKALSQLLSRPFRAVLLKTIGLSLILILLLGVGLHRLLMWLATSGELWAAGALGSAWQTPFSVVLWVVSIIAGIGILVGSVFLMPAVSSLVASFFADDIALQVERHYYPADAGGTALPLWLALWEGVKFAILSVAVYLVALPFLLFAGFGALIFFFATAYLLGRQYFEFAAMRFHSVADAKAMRRRHATTVFLAGLFIAAFVSIPIVNLATPLFGTALMVHMHKRLSARHAITAQRVPARY
jgi:CysZ protein